MGYRILCDGRRLPNRFTKDELTKALEYARLMALCFPDSVICLVQIQETGVQIPHAEYGPLASRVDVH